MTLSLLVSLFPSRGNSAKWLAGRNNYNLTNPALYDIIKLNIKVLLNNKIQLSISIMEDLFTLQTLEQVKALADPLRQRMLGVFCQGPITTKQVAEQLGEKPTRLYHHVTTLEQVGLIRMVETRQNRGMVEKYYQAVATKFFVDRSLFEVAPDLEAASSGVLLIVNALEDALAHFQGDTPATPKGTKPAEDQLVFVHAQNLCLTPSQIADLRSTVCAWLEEQVKECGAETASTDPSHTLTLVLYPVLEGNEGSS